jgi:hypothetical protein
MTALGFYSLAPTQVVIGSEYLKSDRRLMK